MTRIASVAVVAVTALLTSLLVVDGRTALDGRERSDADRNRADRDSAAREYRAVVVFRNDDLEPGHEDELRRAVDRVFVEEGVPVTNAVIPTTGGAPITDDDSFCRELRERRREHPALFEYALHGYTHDPMEAAIPSAVSGEVLTAESEFAGLPYETQRECISEGKRIFVEALGAPPKSFVPPYATADEATVRALAAEGIGAISDETWFTDHYYDETGPFETRGVVHVPGDEDFVRDWETLEFHDRSALRDRFDEAYRDGDLYVQSLHYWTFKTEERLADLRSFVRYVERFDGVLFLTVGRFADARRDGRLTRTDDGWSYVPAEDEAGRVVDTGPIVESKPGDGGVKTLGSFAAAARRLLDR